MIKTVGGLKNYFSAKISKKKYQRNRYYENFKKISISECGNKNEASPLFFYGDSHPIIFHMGGECDLNLLRRH